MLQDDRQDRTLKIATLGRFQVVREGRLLSGECRRASRVWELFKYLVTNRGRDIPSDTLIESLWEEDQPEDPERALRNLVYRLRQILDPEDAPQPPYIVLSRGFYQFNTSGDYWLDTEEFEQSRAQAKSLSTTDPVASIGLYKDCLSLYRGEYLPGQVYADWILPVRNYYRRLFLETFLDYIALLKTIDDLPAIGAVCEQVLQIEPLEEAIHLQYIDCLLRMGKTKEAQAQYNYASSLFYREMGVAPSSDMVEAYRRITMQGELSKETFVQSQLGEHQSNGSYACGPDLFRVICKFEKQRLRPTDAGMFVAGIQLKETDNPDEHAAILSDILRETLRQGDTFCHWKPREFRLLLAVADPERAEKIIKRIVELYERQCDANQIDVWFEPLHLVRQL